MDPLAEAHAVYQDPVDRFLLDAETAAREGDRALAFELIGLAMDFAPGDPTVLLRAWAARNILADATQKARQRNPFFLDAEDVGLTEDDLEMVSVSDAPSPWERAPSAAWTIEEPDMAIPLGQPDTGRPPRKKLPRPLAFALWGVAVLAMGVAGLFAANPSAIGAFGDIHARFFNPLTKAEAAFEAGDLERAREHVRVAVRSGESPAEANLLAGKIALGAGDTAAAVDALTRASGAAQDWEIPLEAARLLAEADEVATAAAAYFRAYEKGAPTSVWRDVADAQSRAGHPDRASRILELLERTTPGR